MGKPAIDTMSQKKLFTEVQTLIDSARIAHPLRGTDPAARRKLRRLIRENPTSIRSFHVFHNLGKDRREWLMAVISAELGTPMAELERWDPRADPWLDDERANGSLIGGHNDPLSEDTVEAIASSD